MWRLPQNLKDVYGLKGEGEEEMGEQRSGADRQERKSLLQAQGGGPGPAPGD